MQYRPLGRTGIEVSPYARGTLMFAVQIGDAEHEDSGRIVHGALDAGVDPHLRRRPVGERSAA